MTIPLTPVDPSAADPLDGWTLPAHWSTAARELFAEVLSQRPDLAGAELSSLEQAAELVTTADALDAVARAAGYVATGSMGQAVVHPATIEGRQTRTAAASILARLPLPSAGARTNSQRARDAAMKRWGAR